MPERSVNNLAVVLVDVQHDFLDPTTPAKVGSWEKAFCIPGIQQLLERARDQQWQIVHVGTKHRDSHTLPLHHRRSGIPLYCEADTPGCEFVISPQPGETVLFKKWYSAFDSGLDRYVDSARTIVWAGVASDCCIQQSAFEADRSGMHSVVPFQAVSASSLPAYVGSLVGMAKSVCDVVDLADVVSSTGEGPAPLEADAIEERSGAWYEAQQSRVGDADGLTLDIVLERLGHRPES
jgi:nicotinamidase-related amidase